MSKQNEISYTSNYSQKILKNCSNCNKEFYVLLQNVKSTYQKAKCPFCLNWNYIENNNEEFDNEILNKRIFDNQENLEIKNFYVPNLDENENYFINNFEKNNTKNSYKNNNYLENKNNIEVDDSDLEFNFNENSNYNNNYNNNLNNQFNYNTTPNKSFFKYKTKIKKLFLPTFNFKFYFNSLLFLVLSLVTLYGLIYFFPNWFIEEEADKYFERIGGNLPNQVIDRNGELLAELFSYRVGNLSPKDISKDFIKILLFVEDQNFYNHHGVNIYAIFRAMYNNIISFGYKQGGSTITQQLARTLFLDHNKNILRKIRELALSFALEKKFSKAQILCAYLNYIYLGHGAYGIENASKFYFQKNINQLNFAEKLIIVSLISAPEKYSPLRNPELLRNKMNFITERMKFQNFPLPENYNELRKKTFYDLKFIPSLNVYRDKIDYAPYISEYIRQKIGEILGNEYMFNAGLKIRTTLDLKLQRASVIETKKFVKENISKYPPTIYKNGKPLNLSNFEKYSLEAKDIELAFLLTGFESSMTNIPKLQSAAIGIENKTGKVLFLQGGTEFGVDNQFNRAIQMRRQTGSAIKPIIYSLAIDKGIITSATILDDEPLNLEGAKGKKKWDPSNIDGKYEGPISVRRALSLSKNLPAIQIGRMLGMRNLRKGFANFFYPDQAEFEKRFRADDTIVIGSLEMSPLEMALAYSSFANNGYIQKPKLILSIEDRKGRILYQDNENDEFNLKIPEKRKVISGDTAEIIVDLLKGGASSHGAVWKGGFSNTQTFVGKTGTSNDYKDAWFVGVTPEITTAVWVGFDNATFSMPKGMGASLAGPLWGRIMKNAKLNNNLNFKFSPRAKPLYICNETGLEYNESCPRSSSRRELFLNRGDEINLKKYKPKAIIQSTVVD